MCEVNEHTQHWRHLFNQWPNIFYYTAAEKRRMKKQKKKWIPQTNTDLSRRLVRLLRALVSALVGSQLAHSEAFSFPFSRAISRARSLGRRSTADDRMKLLREWYDLPHQIIIILETIWFDLRACKFVRRAPVCVCMQRRTNDSIVITERVKRKLTNV